MLTLKNYALEPIKLIEPLPQCGKGLIEFEFDTVFVLSPIYRNVYLDFVIDRDYNLLLGYGHYKLNKKADYLLGAGRVVIDDLIYYIDNDSGHYPNNNTTKYIDCFIENGLIDKLKMTYETTQIQ